MKEGQLEVNLVVVPEIFEIFLKWFYGFSIAITKDNVSDLWILADYYQTPLLQKRLEVYIDKHVTETSDAVDILTTSDAKGVYRLVNKVCDQLLTNVNLPVIPLSICALQIVSHSIAAKPILAQWCLQCFFESMQVINVETDEEHAALEKILSNLDFLHIDPSLLAQLESQTWNLSKPIIESLYHAYKHHALKKVASKQNRKPFKTRM
ncbi:hypothetical protein GEMRC1_006000 [Eukaryota sp. GEM-RC1]